MNARNALLGKLLTNQACQIFVCGVHRSSLWQPCTAHVLLATTKEHDLDIIEQQHPPGCTRTGKLLVHRQQQHRCAWAVLDHVSHILQTVFQPLATRGHKQHQSCTCAATMLHLQDMAGSWPCGRMGWPSVVATSVTAGKLSHNSRQQVTETSGGISRTCISVNHILGNVGQHGLPRRHRTVGEVTDPLEGLQHRKPCK